MSKSRDETARKTMEEIMDITVKTSDGQKQGTSQILEEIEVLSGRDVLSAIQKGQLLLQLRQEWEAVSSNEPPKPQKGKGRAKNKTPKFSSVLKEIGFSPASARKLEAVAEEAMAILDTKMVEWEDMRKFCQTSLAAIAKLPEAVKVPVRVLAAASALAEKRVTSPAIKRLAAEARIAAAKETSVPPTIKALVSEGRLSPNQVSPLAEAVEYFEELAEMGQVLGAGSGAEERWLGAISSHLEGSTIEEIPAVGKCAAGAANAVKTLPEVTAFVDLPEEDLESAVMEAIEAGIADELGCLAKGAKQVESLGGKFWTAWKKLADQSDSIYVQTGASQPGIRKILAKCDQFFQGGQMRLPVEGTDIWIKIADKQNAAQEGKPDSHLKKLKEERDTLLETIEGMSRKMNSSREEKDAAVEEATRALSAEIDRLKGSAEMLKAEKFALKEVLQTKDSEMEALRQEVRLLKAEKETRGQRGEYVPFEERMASYGKHGSFKLPAALGGKPQDPVASGCLVLFDRLAASISRCLDSSAAPAEAAAVSYLLTGSEAKTAAPAAIESVLESLGLGQIFITQAPTPKQLAAAG